MNRVGADDVPPSIRSPQTLLVAIVAGIAATAVFNLAPLYLAAAVAAHHVPVRQSGLLLSAEVTGIALASGAALLAGDRWTPRSMIRMGGIVVLAGNLLSLAAPGFGVLLALRLLTGLSGDGLVYAAALQVLARSLDPVRAFALFSFTSMCVTAAGLVLLPHVPTDWSWPTVLLLFALLGGLASILAYRIPRQWSSTQHGGAFRFGIGWLGLVAVFVYTLDLGAVWAYAEPLGRGLGVEGHLIGQVLAGSIAAQAAGSLTAARFGGRIDPRYGLFLVLILQGGGLGLLASQTGMTGFAVGLGLWGFGWNFGIALLLGLLARQANGSRLLTLVPGTEAVGAATGPAVVAAVGGVPLVLAVPAIGFAGLIAAVAAAIGLLFGRAGLAARR